ncbi:MAG TPA: ATP-binding protein [Polyangiaceae bacterium]|nr:ATP-binding protein [Polyangiaceae bacterium]
MIHYQGEVNSPLEVPFEVAMDGIPDALAVLTAADSPIEARIVYVNAAFVKLSGYAPEQLIGHSSLLLAGARPDFDHVSEVQRAAKGSTFFATTRKFRPDGSAYDVDMWLSPLRDGSGAISHYLLRERDLTEQDPEPALSQARRALVESLPSAACLAAGAAYELEEPLLRIDACLNAMLEGKDAGGRHDGRALRLALAETGRAWDVVRGLQAFVDPETERVRAVDVRDAIEAALKLTKVATERRATVVRRYGAVPRTVASRRRLTAVLVAVLRNAASSIRVGSPHANSIVIETTALEKQVAIEISDTGAGIEKEDLPYIFDPFFTTKAEPRSMGLGLAAARVATLDMHGEISVDSTLGYGTRVRIVLPASAEPVEGDALLFEESPKLRVLCVAATRAEAARIESFFDAAGAHVLYASFDDAVEELAIRGPYDLVLCDGRSSRRGEFRRHLREFTPDMAARTIDVGRLDDGSGGGSSRPRAPRSLSARGRS